MIPAEIIRKARDSEALNEEEISFIVEGAACGTIPDYQLSAFLMAIYSSGMSDKETFLLTKAMKNSGHSLDWKKLNPKLRNFPLIDKHSTGGVGDKVSLIIVPLAVLLGLKIPMMSGRGLGHTGGTVDKLLSIPGLKMDFSYERAAQILTDVGAVMLSQTQDLCPADKKLYALRDVTATVESLPLITGSIISKKWAEGCEGIVFDVKYGPAAFMADRARAEELANWLLRVGKLASLKAEALITRMDEPLGTCIGNALEVEESNWILKNDYPSQVHKEIARPLRILSCETAASMALLGGTRSNFVDCVAECEKFLDSGKAFEIFNQMLRAQGADSNWERSLPRCETVEIHARQNGVLKKIDSRSLGLLGVEIKMGRKKMDDQVDPGVGFEVLVTLGSRVQKGDLIARLYLRENFHQIRKSFLDCIHFGDNSENIIAEPLLWKTIRQNS